MKGTGGERVQLRENDLGKVNYRVEGGGLKEKTPLKITTVKRSSLIQRKFV